tara:strand:- start:300289 stop:300906 length:618 start_codon:yes stop_codon:yes gene_type:complete
LAFAGAQQAVLDVQMRQARTDNLAGLRKCVSSSPGVMGIPENRGIPKAIAERFERLVGTEHAVGFYQQLRLDTLRCAQGLPMLEARLGQVEHFAIKCLTLAIEDAQETHPGAEIANFYIWTGWLAFLIFVPLAITSTDGWIRRLGSRWKTLQRFVYGAAVLTLLHWASLHDWGGVAPMLVHFGPLGALEAYRVWAIVQKRTLKAA